MLVLHPTPGGFLAAEWLFSMRDTQGTPVKLWWRAPLKVQGCVLSGSGVGGSSGEVLSTFGARCSSLILVGLLLSGCERLHSTYFRDLVCQC